MKDFKKIAKITMYVSVFGIVGGMAYQGVDFAVNSFKSSEVSDSSDVDNQSVDNGKSESDDNKSAQVKTAEASENDKASIGTVSAINSSSDSKQYTDVSAVAEAVLPSIVAINVTETVQQDYFGRTYEQQSSGSGSGIIIADRDNEILIATNNHVVSGADTVNVEFADGESVAASVKGTDSDNDLAVVSVKKSDLKETTLDAIRIAKLGSSDDATVGEMVVAIGNALGYGQSVTVGYISAKDRKIDVEDGSMSLIQTDAAINPGNSGGALVNMKGEVVGINSAKFASEEVEGMGFSIPISKAVTILESLANKETIPEEEQAYLGISGADISNEYSKTYNVPTGVYVQKVTVGSPAEKAGIKEGMIITSINDKDVTGLSGLQNILSSMRAGDKVNVKVVTGNMGQYSDSQITVTLGSKSEQK